MAAVLHSGLRTLREHPFELLREMERRGRAAAAGARADEAVLEEWTGIGFRVGTERFVVPRDQVREVLMVPSVITRVPGARSWIRGLSNVRGHLLPIIDLREFLGAGLGGLDRTARVLVTGNAEFTVGIIVDEVFGFRRFVEREFSPERPGTALRAGAYLAGSYRRGAESWPVLSLSRLLEAPEFQRGAAE